MTIRRVDQQPTISPSRTEAPAPAARNQPAAPARTSESTFGSSPQGATALNAPVRPGDHLAQSMAVGTVATQVAPGPLNIRSKEAQQAIQKSLEYVSEKLNMRSAGDLSNAFGARVVERDELGMTHVRLDRVHEGVRVLGEQVISHLDRDGNVAGLTGDAHEIPAGLGSQQPAISQRQAIETAKELFGGPLDRRASVEKVIYQADDGTYKAGYRVELTNLTGGERPMRMNYLVDGQTGQVDRKWNQIGGIEIPPNLKADAASVTVKGSASPNAKVNDLSKVESKITINDDVTIEKLGVGLDIPHTYKGDLVVTLRSPSGKEAVIHNRTGGSADNVAGTFDLSAFAGESSKGEWTLTVEDKARRDTGTLKTWGLEITGTPKNPPPTEEAKTIEKAATPNARIEDNKTVTSTIDISDDGAIDTLALDLDIAHTYRGDLTVKLTSPSGTTAIISNREGGSADDLKGAFDLSDFAGEKVTGQWKLEVTDSAAQDTGTFKSWGLKIKTKGKDEPPPPPPPGGADDSTLYGGKVDLGPLTKGADGSYTLNDTTRGKGVETLDAKGASRPGSGVAIKDNNNAWMEAGDPANQKAATDAQYGAQMTYDFFKNVLGRDSIDGKGEKLKNNVHIGKNYVNAFWDGTQMSYGDGDGRTAGPLTTLDIAGHEIAHGLTERTAGLIYSGESGGINESMSDIMGFGVEWYAAQQNGQVKWDWNMGEDAWTPTNGDPNDALRYLDDPTKDDYSIDHYSNYPKQTEVHGSSGIMNNAFYLLAAGGTNKTSKITVADGIGPEAALKIYGRALMFYMTPNTKFADAREATIKAATDLFGASSVQVQKVKESWHAVGVG